MSTRLKLAFSTRPAQQWIDVAFGSPRRLGRRRVERRQFACVRCAASTSDPHHGNPRSIFGAGMRGDQDGDAGWGRRCISARRFRRGSSRCVRACSNARCAHGSGRLINAAGSIRSARARVSSTRGLTCCRVGSRPKATDRRASNALRGSRSTRAAREARPTYSIFQRKPIGSSRSARYGRAT
jgi:hypothetical protein